MPGMPLLPAAADEVDAVLAEADGLAALQVGPADGAEDLAEGGVVAHRLSQDALELADHNRWDDGGFLRGRPEHALCCLCLVTGAQVPVHLQVLLEPS